MRETVVFLRLVLGGSLPIMADGTRSRVAARVRRPQPFIVSLAGTTSIYMKIDLGLRLVLVYAWYDGFRLDERSL